jgi:hypothetical protein
VCFLFLSFLSVFLSLLNFTLLFPLLEVKSLEEVLARVDTLTDTINLLQMQVQQLLAADSVKVKVGSIPSFFLLSRG